MGRPTGKQSRLGMGFLEKMAISLPRRIGHPQCHLMVGVASANEIHQQAKNWGGGFPPRWTPKPPVLAGGTLAPKDPFVREGLFFAKNSRGLHQRWWAARRRNASKKVSGVRNVSSAETARGFATELVLSVANTPKRKKIGPMGSFKYQRRRFHVGRYTRGVPLTPERENHKVSLLQ